MSKTQGIHHVALRPSTEDYQKVVTFYTDVLQMKMKRTWGTADKPSCMIDIGGGSCMEILSAPQAEEPLKGVLEHIAFATEQVDELIEAVRAAGYEIITEPTDIFIDDAKGGLPARIAFCKGPMGEIIEFFHE